MRPLDFILNEQVVDHGERKVYVDVDDGEGEDGEGEESRGFRVVAEERVGAVAVTEEEFVV